jgi:response regulator RpfG family c-di-GMP phosphodiesterase
MTALQPHSVRMLLTASADFQTAQRAINEAGLFRYLTKPWSDAELGAHFEAALQAADGVTT